MSSPSPLGPEPLLQRILDLLHEDGVITPEQRREVIGRAPLQRSKLLNERRAEAQRSGRARRSGIEVSDAEIVASFQLPMRADRPGAKTGAPARVVTEEVIAETLARDAGMPFEHLDPLKLDFAFVTKMISGPFAERHSVIPLAMEDGFLKVAVANPYATETLEQLPRITGQRIRPVVATHKIGRAHV